MPTPKPGATLTLDELRETVRDAVEADGRTHAELAEALNLSGRGAVSKALSATGGTRYGGTLGDLLTLLTGRTAEAETVYRIGPVEGRRGTIE